jgi:actin-related protein
MSAHNNNNNNNNNHKTPYHAVLDEWLARLLMKEGFHADSAALKRCVVQMKEAHCFVSVDMDGDLARVERRGGPIFTMPDDSSVSLGSASFLAPELLFRPSNYGLKGAGVAEALYTAIHKCDVDVRKDMYGNMVVAGGSSMFPGFEARLEAEVASLAPSTMPLHVVAPPERSHSQFIGGSILVALSTFKTMWILKEEYDEGGPAIVHRKCF